MGKFSKWIAGGLGWAFFGPIGGLLGFAIGSMMDNRSQQAMSGLQQKTTTGAYAMSLLVLVAAVMRADGKVVRAELDYVKQYFVKAFGSDAAREAIRMLGDLLKQNIPLRDVSLQIKQNLDYSSRLQLLHLLFGISAADSKVDPDEIRVIEQIASYLGLSKKDTDSIKYMFIEKTDSVYKILEINPDANDEDVKKAYRNMANKYHPDKVSHLGEDFQKIANEKFQKVNDAYRQIKKERKIA
ncbi:MAG: TerB family tellurite resistance protein [Bacteroidetes bacterium]|nr:TerB family tellurite resistance protein [Bacteroidota bacterium]